MQIRTKHPPINHLHTKKGQIEQKNSLARPKELARLYETEDSLTPNERSQPVKMITPVV